jgi:hypothetical protein
MLMSLDTSTTSRPGAALGLAQALHHAQDLVVGLALGQAGGQLARPAAWSGRTACRRLRGGRSWPAGCRPGVEAAALVGVARRVQFAADLARIARHLAHALLVVVQFFQRDHRQEDVVFLEAEQRHRVVHQHVGVQHEQLGRPAARGLRPRGRAAAGCRGQSTAWWAGGRAAGVQHRRLQRRGGSDSLPPCRLAGRLGRSCRRRTVEQVERRRSRVASALGRVFSARLSVRGPACARSRQRRAGRLFLGGGLGSGRRGGAAAVFKEKSRTGSGCTAFVEGGGVKRQPAWSAARGIGFA